MWPDLTKRDFAIAGNTGVWLIICTSNSVQPITTLQISVKSPWILTQLSDENFYSTAFPQKSYIKPQK